MSYKKVSKDDVYRVLVGASVEPFNPIGGAINVVNIANLLETSRYQAKKYIDELKQEGMVELKCIDLMLDPEECDDVYPPYWGYVLTKKGKDTDYYKERDAYELKLIQECFS